MIRLAVLLCLSPVLGLAESWSGVLVDSKCWTNEEHNINPRDTTLFVDRDRNLEIRFCAPSPKTKSFVIVPADGVGLQLDSAGNGRAADVVRNAGKEPIYRVAITGNLAQNMLHVDSISILK